MGRETAMELERPSIVATLLWAFGIFLIGLTVYSIINWPGDWTESLHDVLLVFVAFSSGINAIATGALIDMHTMRHKTGRKAHRCSSPMKIGSEALVDLVREHP